MFRPNSKLHFIKNRYLRWKTGTGCCDCHSLKTYLATIIVPSLEKFKIETISHPIDLTSDEWSKNLDDMIFAFKYYLNEDNRKLTDFKKSQKGLKLFAKYYNDLWS